MLLLINNILLLLHHRKIKAFQTEQLSFLIKFYLLD